jgi:6-phosphogluconolactonase
MEDAMPSGPIVYAGNYTNVPPFARGRAGGIGVYRLDPESGALEPLQVAAGSYNPTWLTTSPDRRFLYAVDAVSELDGVPGGGVSAWAIDPTTGFLGFINRQSTGGPGPCHVGVEATGRYVVVTNYVGGSVAMLPRRADGGLDPLSDFHQHTGSGPNPNRQERPHAHSVNADPTNRYAFVCDLGLDRVFAYRLDLVGGKLVLDESRTVVARPGVGPRHLAWHPSGRFAFVLNEIDGSVDAFAFDPVECRLTRTNFAPGLPARFVGENTAAEVRALPNGRFVYGSQRGHDSISIWSFDERTGSLALVGNQPSGGKTPRNFTIDAAGRLMLVAHQDDDRVVAFRIDPTTGALNPTGAVSESPSAVCLRIVE